MCFFSADDHPSQKPRKFAAALQEDVHGPFCRRSLEDTIGVGWWSGGDLWWFNGNVDLPSGKHTKNDGKSPFSMGKSTINGYFQ